jgi:transcriptional regulator with XRE-family HTH domain
MPIDQEMLGAAIKSVRVTRGLTQSQLATRLGFSNGGIALIEQGRRAVSMSTLNAIAKALDLPPGCLAILGSRTGGNSKPLADFVEGLKHAITTLIIAQSKMAANGQKKGSHKRAIKKVSKRRNRVHSEGARVAATPDLHPSKTIPAKSRRHKIAAGH